MPIAFRGWKRSEAGALMAPEGSRLPQGRFPLRMHSGRHVHSVSPRRSPSSPVASSSPPMPPAGPHGRGTTFGARPVAWRSSRSVRFTGNSGLRCVRRTVEDVMRWSMQGPSGSSRRSRREGSLVGRVIVGVEHELLIPHGLEQRSQKLRHALLDRLGVGSPHGELQLCAPLLLSFGHAGRGGRGGNGGPGGRHSGRRWCGR